MDWFISFILITIAVFYIIRVAGRYLLRRWIERKQREFSQQFGGDGGYTYKQYTWGRPKGQRGTSASDRTRKQEGEVRIENLNPTRKKVSRDVGEYVEYEEVEVEYDETSK